MMTHSHPHNNDGEVQQCCPVCGYKTGPDATYCKRCGMAFDLEYEDDDTDLSGYAQDSGSVTPRKRPALSQQCPVCGELNRPGVMLCEACGTHLATGKRLPVSTRLIGDGKHDFADMPLDGSDTVDIDDLVKNSTSGTSVFDPDMILRIQIEDGETPLLLRMAPHHPVVFGRQDSTEQPIDIDLGQFYGYAKGISRLHAALELIDNRLELMDIGSSNGTYLNGNRLEPNQPQQLRDGDEIRFGRLAMAIYFEKRVNR